MSASRHDLGQCFAVFHLLRFPLTDLLPFFLCLGGLALFPMLFYGLVFGIEHFPSVAYAQLIDYFGNELLYMETVVDKGRPRKTVADNQHHCRRQVCRDCFDPQPCTERYLRKHGGNGVRRPAPHHGRQRAALLVRMV